MLHRQCFLWAVCCSVNVLSVAALADDCTYLRDSKLTVIYDRQHSEGNTEIHTDNINYRHNIYKLIKSLYNIITWLLQSYQSIETQTYKHQLSVLE